MVCQLELTGKSLSLVDNGAEHGSVRGTEGDLLSSSEASHGNDNGGNGCSELHFEGLKDWLVGECGMYLQSYQEGSWM